MIQRMIPLFALLILCCFSAAQAEVCSDPNPLRFSVVTKTNALEQIQRYRPLMDLLQKKINRKVEMVVPTSYDTAIEGLLSGQIDFAEMGPAAYALAKSRDSSIEAFATYARPKGKFNEQGVHYHSVLIVRADSRYQNAKSLAKAKVSFVDPASTSGAVIPRAFFSNEIGMPLEVFFGGIAYAGSHERAAQAVANGYTDAAFVSSALLDQAIADHMFKGNEFRVLWKSGTIPNEPSVYRSKLCGYLKDKIREIYFSRGDELVPLLVKLKAEKFVPVDDENYRIILDLVETQSGR